MSREPRDDTRPPSASGQTETADDAAAIDNTVDAGFVSPKAVADPALDATVAPPSLDPALDATVAPPPAVDPSMDATLAVDEGDAAHPEGAAQLTPEVVGRYHFEGGKAAAMLGHGGIGAVYLATDHHVGREVAVKELREGAGGSQPSVPVGSDGGTVTATAVRFLREARITGQLQHPNIVPVHEIGRRADGTLYYTMKVVRGQTLGRALKGCETLAERLNYLSHVADLCQAIAYAHHRGVIHRDIKPENVMVGEFGETVVLDWGLAKARGEKDHQKRRLTKQIPIVDAIDASQTVSGEAIGTPAYMSPEQAAGDIDGIDERSDIWSLGAVLYELLTGRPPYVGKTALTVIEAVKSEPLTPVRDRCPDAPPDLAAVANKALRRDKSERYGSARQMAADIAAFQSGARVAAYEYSSWELLKRMVRKNRAVAALICLLLASGVAGSLAIYSAYKDALRAEKKALVESRRARAARKRAEENERRAHFNYALSMASRAERRLAAKDHLAARIYAAQSLLYNPYNPHSPHRFAEAAQLTGPRAARRLARSASVWFQATAHQRVTYRRTLWGHGSNINDLRFSADGRLLLSASWDATVRLWDPQTGRALATLASPRGATDRLWAVALSPDGRTVAAAGTGRVVQLWDRATKKPSGQLTGHTNTVHGLAYSPDGTLLASASEDQTVRLWPVGKAAKPGAEPRVLRGHTATVTGVAFSPDGQTLATASRDRTVRLWRVSDATLLRTLTGHEDRVWGVTFSPDGRTLATSSWDRTLRLWRTADGGLIKTLRGHRGPVYAVRFSTDGRTLVSCGGDHTVRLWRTDGGALLSTVSGHSDWCFAAALSPDGKTLASGNGDKNLKLWRVHPAKGVRRLRGHSDTVFSLACAPDGKTLASGSGDRTVRLWSTADNRPLATLAGHGGPVRFVAFAPDGKGLASGSYDNQARLWDLASQRTRVTLSGHLDRIYSLAFAPDGKTLATGSWDKTVRLWDLATGKATQTLTGHKKPVWSVALSPDGRTLLSAGFDQVVNRWTGPGFRQRRLFARYPHQVPSIRFSPDGKLVASAGRDGTLQIRRTTGALVRRLRGHRLWVNRVRWSPDGRTLLSGSDDRTARLWDVASGRLRLTLQLSALGLGIAFCPGGRQIAVNDGPDILRYPVPKPTQQPRPEHLLETAQREAGLVLEKNDRLVPLHRQAP